ncbi:MAG: DUF4446 family protein [Actinomycetota bacterium]|nr:DUF4446 family protein [Actinomycetota bacterium]
MHNLTSTTGIVSLAAGAAAVIALLLGIVLVLRVRRLRSDQRIVLGERREDVVAHAARLQGEFVALTAYLQDVAGRLEERMGVAEQRLDGAVAYSSLVRYDAYGEMSGRQSTSIALLDATRSGIVLSSILHRDHARLYAKQVSGGRGELELSPEEDEAVRLALSGGQPASTG